jgi:cell division septal protein FtsQ
MAANKQQPEEEQAAQAIDARGQATTGGELAERHHRTSKHRAPRQGAKATPRRQKAAAEKPAQRTLPFGDWISIPSWLSSGSFSSGTLRTGRVIVIGGLIFSVLVFVYYYFAGSKFFMLREIDIHGNVLLTREQVTDVVKSVVKKGVLRADLNQIRDKLKSNELVKDVEVTRLLPDMLRIVISERDPYAPARRSDGSVVCVDREGVMFGDQSLLKSKPILPLINGLAEGADKAEINRGRMMTYEKLIADLDGSQPPLSSRIDEVFFDEVQGVRVVLADSRIAVYLGTEDFRMRLNAALDVLDAIRTKDAEALKVLRIADAEKLLSGANISYLNATTPKRVVVGLNE